MKYFETAFETYPQFIVGLFIWQGLQIQNTKNLVSISFSAISIVYGFGDLIAYHVNGDEARAPFSWTGLSSTLIFLFHFELDRHEQIFRGKYILLSVLIGIFEIFESV